MVASLLAAPARAQDARYHAVPLDPGYDFGVEKALILDTTDGHLWIWMESPATPDGDGGRYLIYQGQVKPGRSMGDIIEQQEWRKK
ncbi:MAG: hypothetical protein HKO62_09170 [Gammaproteobacteria bacterium]|nr:hypothetical protein [Gammaproteobacteria bacterium]NNM00906.1 hypothetical protein [Gammaproteobacteria bacterium]